MSQTSSILYPKEDNIDETIRRADKKDEHGGVKSRVRSHKRFSSFFKIVSLWNCVFIFA